MLQTDKFRYLARFASEFSAYLVMSDSKLLQLDLEVTEWNTLFWSSFSSIEVLVELVVVVVVVVVVALLMLVTFVVDGEHGGVRCVKAVAAVLPCINSIL